MRSFLFLGAILLAGCGGGGTMDGGTDLGVDAGADAGTDLGTPDLGQDLGHDAGPDLGVDAGMPDAGPRCGLLGRTHVATGLAGAIYATAPDGDDRIFVVEHLAGHVAIVDATGTVRTTPFLDVSADLDALGYEAGLLSLAFHPDYATHPRVFVSYTRPGGILRVARFDVPAGTPNAVDPASEMTVIDIPAGTTGVHHDTAGMLAFGPDGYLYIGVGDQTLDANGQTSNTFDGKLLRIDVDATTAPYAVPPTNPYLGMSGVLPEIFAFGLREPYRLSFDAMTHDLWIAEVGDATSEEIDVLPSGDPGGENFGWPIMEGFGCHTPPLGCSMTGLTTPTYTYSHMGGHAAIMGGHVYRGTALPVCWQGAYFYGDYELGFIDTLRYDAAGGVTDVEQHDEISTATTLAFPLSLGRDGAGEVLVVGVDGSIDRIVPGP